MTGPNFPSPAEKAQPPARPSPGPGDSLGAVVDQDALADGEGAVVPHQEEVKDGVCHPGSHRAGCKGTCWGHGHRDSPWDTHPQDRDLLLTTKATLPPGQCARCFTRISCSALDTPG